MSPLFQLVYSTAYSPDEYLIPTGFIQQLSYSTAYSLDESLIPTGFIQQLFYSTAYSLDESLIPTGFIQQLFYSTAYSLDESLIPTVLFNSCSPDGRPLFQLTFYSWMAALIWSAFFILTFFIPGWPPLFGRPSLFQLILFNFLFLDGRPYLVGLLYSN